ncbi:hypothetical protein GV829_10485 [Sphingomonas lacunae]|uniref:Uncharacterized protein n=1 Tax=Sphingomonas lacunae TaxID=2698828 RepID=A0A6M4AUJ7_9SPHN|nr:hypothetical protein [Sphingomonas lacunae]QJQ32817.1 hypothetical protein GV829_10485 [Sphingomonas lacunae]
MKTVALAAAQLLTDDVDAWGMPMLRALLPLAGMTLIEQQAERSRAIGVSQFLVLVDGVPPALAEACDRIRARGLAVDLVRSGADVLRLAKGHDRLLLIADGLIAGDQIWKAAGSARAANLLVTADASVTRGLERIDASARWAGLAVLPAAAIAALETAPRDWDPQLLLFRAAVQDGAGRTEVDTALFVSGDMMLAETSDAVAALERRLLAAPLKDHGGIGRRHLAGPLVRLFAGRLMGAQNSGKIARTLAPLSFIGASTAFLFGQPVAAIVLGIVGVLADEAANFVAQFRAEATFWARLTGVGLVTQLLAFLIAERGATWSEGGLHIGEGSFPLVILVGLSALPNRMRCPVDDVMAWVLVGFFSVLTGWQSAYDWTVMVALTLLLLAQFDWPEGGISLWKRFATKNS